MSCCAELLGCRHSFQKGGILQALGSGSCGWCGVPIKDRYLQPGNLTAKAPENRLGTKRKLIFQASFSGGFQYNS